MPAKPRPITPATAPAAIAAHLTRITHQHFFKTFDDWVALAVHAFARDESAYMEIMGRYGPREAPMGTKDHPADHFARALGVWMAAMQAEPADYLGRIYEEQAVANSYAGQFFTPESLTELMASLTLPDDLADNALVNDPACGSGRMLIAGIRRNRFATFLGTDTDLTCVRMTALNCLLRNAATYVIHGNSLSLVTHGGYFVKRTWAGGELYPLSKDDTDRLIRMPLRSSPEAATALTVPAPQIIQEPSPEVQAALDEVAGQFKVNKRGQGDFGF